MFFIATRTDVAFGNSTKTIGLPYLPAIIAVLAAILSCQPTVTAQSRSDSTSQDVTAQRIQAFYAKRDALAQQRRLRAAARERVQSLEESLESAEDQLESEKRNSRKWVCNAYNVEHDDKSQCSKPELGFREVNYPNPDIAIAAKKAQDRKEELADAKKDRESLEQNCNALLAQLVKDARAIRAEDGRFELDQIKNTYTALGSDPKYQPKQEYNPATGKMETKTYCNIFVRDLATKLVGKELPELAGQANNQYSQLSTAAKDGRDWRTLSFQADNQGAFTEAQRLANQGHLVIAASKNDKGNGHIALVVAKKGEMHESTKWGQLKVPDIVQAGEKVFGKPQPLSAGFGPNKKPSLEIFVYGRTKNQ